MAIFTIDNSFAIKRKSPIYYIQYNKVYYKSKYKNNFITKPANLFDGTHDTSEFGFDSSSDKRLFINNKINRVIFYV
jgi:hypothetical protein